MSSVEWPTEVKQRALELYVSDGPSAASRATGVPSGTIRGWAHKEGLTMERAAEVLRERLERADADEAEREAARLAEVELLSKAQARAERKRLELRELLLDRALELLHRMDDEHIDYRGKDAELVVFPRPSAADCQRYMTAAAVAIDKYRLEVGESTSRAEVVSDSALDREIEQLMDRMAARSQAATEA